MPQYNKTSLNDLMPENANTGLPWKLLLVSILVLFVSFSVYFGFLYGYRPRLTAQIRDLKDDLASLGSEVSDADRASFLNFYSQFVNLKSILDKHITASGLFQLLEQNTHEGIYYTSSALDIKNLTLTLQGVSGSYEILAAQGTTFKDIPDIKNVIFDDMQTSEKGVGFKLRLMFDPKFFKNESR